MTVDYSKASARKNMIKREELLKRRPDFGRESGWNARCALAKLEMVGDRKVSPFARRTKPNKFEK